ncbi:unnamed protein product [Closterium sp. Yama58-4]|nr:unnamed protein product [Closterium sp. Yama58-4]
MFSARGAEGEASKQSTPRSGLKGILRGTLSDRRMKGSRKPVGGAKQAEKQDGKKKSKAALPQTATQKPAENKNLASALASHLQSLYKGEGVLVVEDDKRIIFYCTLCDVWAYHDASLIDHIHGKKHKRKQAEATPLTSPPSSVSGSPPWEKTSKLTPPWKLVGEGKTSAPSSKRKAPHSSDASMSAGGGSKRQRRANGQDVAVTPGDEANARDIVPETGEEEELDEPCRPEDFALALFKFTNLIGRRGKWEKQLLKWSDAGPGEKHIQKEELPLLADVPAEHPEEIKKQRQDVNEKEVSGDGDEAVKEKEPNATSAELHCTDKPAEVNAVAEEAGGARSGDDSTAVPGPHEAAAGRVEEDPAGDTPAAPVPEAVAGADASGDGKAPAAVPAKRRKGALGAGAGASAARVCFLCQLPMMEGQVVGALWNARLKQFACSSRNRHKKFHIFHSHCIADWVVFCSAVASTSVPPALCCPLEADVAHLLSSMHRHHKPHTPSLGPSRQASGAATPAAATAAGRVTKAVAAAAAAGAGAATAAAEAGGKAPVSAGAAAEAIATNQQGDAPQCSRAEPVVEGAGADGSSASSDELHSDAWAWAGIPDAIYSSATAAAVATSALAAAAATGPVSSEDAAVVAIVATAAASAAASLMAPPPAPPTTAPALSHVLGKRSSADTAAQGPGKVKSSAPAAELAAASGAAGAARKAVPGKEAESEAAVSAGAGGAALPAATAAPEGAEALEGAKLLPLTEVFCPECQGTGRYGPRNALEHPRYRLAQVFDWIVAMMVARHKATLAQKGTAASSGKGEHGGDTADVGVANKGDATMADADGAAEGGEKTPEGGKGIPEVGDGTPEGRENVERSAGRGADKGLCDKREETAAEAAPPPPPATTPSQATHSAAVTGGSPPGNEAGMQDTGAGSSMGVVAGSSMGVVAGSSMGVVAGSSMGVVAGSSMGVVAGSSMGVVAGSSMGVVAGSSMGVVAGSSMGVVAGSSMGVVAGSSMGVVAGSSMGVVAGSVQASSPVESAAEKKGSDGGCRLRFADQTVQKAADSAFHNLRFLPAECLSAHLGKGKRTGTATGPKKHA